MAADFSDLNFDVIKDTYIGCFKKFLVIEGRARRREFWIFCLINVILGLIPVIGWVVGFVTCIPSFTVAVRRLHDINKSGKYMFLMLIPLGVALILMIGFIAAMGNGGALIVILILILIASLAPAVMLLIWAAKEGDKGSNNYGPDPKGASGKKAASTAKSKSKK